MCVFCFAWSGGGGGGGMCNEACSINQQDVINVDKLIDCRRYSLDDTTEAVWDKSKGG